MSKGYAERIDPKSLAARIEELAGISEAPAPAVTRVLFSETDLKARELIRQWARQQELEIREDAVGNIFARWVGSEPRLPAVATGSHTDAIPNAGRYDGVVGVLGGLEALAALRRGGFKPRRSLEVIMFTAEEPTRYGLGCLGSRLMSGSLNPAAADQLRDGTGRTLADLRAGAGYRGGLDAVRLPSGHYHGFVELHIEQGPILEREGKSIGLVDAIAGPSSYRLIITGEGGHAGAVLMPQRRDAGVAGAEIVLAVERAALEGGSPDLVATTGVFRVAPGACNSIPNRAEIEIDLRDTRLETRTAALERIRRSVQEICARRGVKPEWTDINADPPATCDPALVAAAEAASIELGLTSRRMVSRAYHDSLFMARVCPTTMIFIPCRNGWSHRPDEYSSLEAITAGTAVLTEMLAKLAG